MQILAIFCETSEIRKRNMVGILSQIVNKEMLDKVILILQRKMNSHARKVLDDYPVKVEVFQVTEFAHNGSSHLNRNITDRCLRGATTSPPLS